MSDESARVRAPRAPAVVWSGRILTALIGAVFLLSGAMKLAGGPELQQGFEQMGLPQSMAAPLGVIEIICVLAYFWPRTAVLGAILLTGYLGGAICTHWRVGELFVGQVVLAVLVWLATALREPRLWDVCWRK